MKRHLHILLFLLLCTAVAAQMQMDTWRTHFCYGTITQIAVAKENTYALSNGALFAVSHEYNSITLYSKIDGLNDTHIAHIAYSTKIGALIISYQNANIDLLYDDGTVENIPDILQSTLTVSKAVNSIFFKDQYAYLCCDFGITVLNLQRKEIAETYYIGPGGSNIAVRSLCYHAGNFYATTENTIYKADAKKLLVNYENWEEQTSAPADKKLKTFTFAGNIWTLTVDSTLYQYNPSSDTWTPRTDLGKFGATHIGTNHIITSSTSSTVKRYDTAFNATTTNGYRFTDIAYDPTHNKYWAATTSLYAYDYGTSKFATYAPNGPALNYNYDMASANGRMYVLLGSRWTNQQNAYVMIYEDNQWNYIAPSAFQVAPANTSIIQTIRPWSLVDMAFDPKDPQHYYISSWGNGIYEFRNDKLVKLHNAENSVIESALSSDYPKESFFRYTRTDELAFDDNGYLWFVNDYATDAIKYMTPKGEIKVYHTSLMDNTRTVEEFLVSNKNTNQKWIAISRGSGYIFVFDDKGTVEDTSDDYQRLFTSFTDQDGNELNPDFVFSMEQDADGTIWIGTSAGVFITPKPESVFYNDFTFQRIKIARNDGTNDADYLLDNERINVIKTDGVNRKWIGTSSSGLFLLSSDGTETIHHFTQENSPLPSNCIQSLAINNLTGEVFIGTDNGIVSYQSDAADPKEDLKQLQVYPNPVRETYEGIITITGLMENTTVKIVDSGGHTVYQTTSKGSLATWDGKGLSGKRVSTGVYFVFCITDSRKVYARTKILFMK